MNGMQNAKKMFYDRIATTERPLVYILSYTRIYSKNINFLLEKSGNKKVKFVDKYGPPKMRSI